VESKGQVVKSMVLIRRPGDGALLVSESVNPAGMPFHRPLGGHVEFGEYAADTARRELEEEIGQQITGLQQVGVLENIFDWSAVRQHEIVFVFAASFADEAAYEISEQTIRDDVRQPRVIWRAPDAISPPLYPVGFADLAAQIS
jgi:ADP-ribose pyrophosphatase YjhB (NUDIX family)